MKTDVYQIVTDRIIEELEKGSIPWKRPWTGVSSGAISHTTGKPYSLLNQMLLGKPGEYVTFKQCTAEGGKVKKDAKASIVVFWKWIEVEDEETKKKKKLPLLNYYRVFHIDQCEGLKEKYADRSKIACAMDDAADEAVTGYVERTGVKILHSVQNEAFYSPARDVVSLPAIEQFTDTAEYYGTEFHELVHSTGHWTRLNRFKSNSSNAAFGSEDYSKEELVAEIGAATLCAEFGLETKNSFKNSAAYIQSWLNALKNDKRLIVSAASRAEKAVKLILNILEVDHEQERM